jgi:hypothetical protein
MSIALSIEPISRGFTDWDQSWGQCAACGATPAHDPIHCVAVNERRAPIADRAAPWQAGCAVVAYRMHVSNMVHFGHTKEREHDAARWATLARALGAWQ